MTGLKPRSLGSLEVDSDIIRAAGLFNYERVVVVNMESGERFETYIYEAPPGSEEIILAGGAAALGKPGDDIGWLAFSIVPAEEAPTWRPKIVVLTSGNAIDHVVDGDIDR